MKLALPAFRLLAVGHDRLVHGRRVRVLADAIAPLLDPGWRVLDVGCGDGRLAALLAARNPSLTVEGADVQVRGETAIPVRRFDGRHLPGPDQSVAVAEPTIVRIGWGKLMLVARVGQRRAIG